MRPKSSLDAGRVDFRMRLENRSPLEMSAEETLERDLRTEVDFVPSGGDFRCNYISRLCATRGGLKMQKMKSTFWKAKVNEKSEKRNSFAAGAGLRLRPKSGVPPEWAWVRLLVSTCATGVGLST
jgi:hypothetical protein